jgi:hypothetical protein
MPFIEAMQAQHEAITRTFEDAQRAGFASADVVRTLLSAKRLLLDHLRQEDGELYPKLETVAKNNPNLGGMVEMFRVDMAEVSALAQEFFRKYEREQQRHNPALFADDVAVLVRRLKMRISLEEKVLYPEYSLCVEEGSEQSARR